MYVLLYKIFFDILLVVAFQLNMAALKKGGSLSRLIRLVDLAGALPTARFPQCSMAVGESQVVSY